jgi:hypothetical protein
MQFFTQNDLGGYIRGKDAQMAWLAYIYISIRNLFTDHARLLGPPLVSLVPYSF